MFDAYIWEGGRKGGGKEGGRERKRFYAEYECAGGGEGWRGGSKIGGAKVG